MSIFDRNLIQVNGPINVVRMEGEINGVQKVIYIFMDQHAGVTEQTKCDNVFAKNIDTYFAESFYDLNNSEIMYDFFLEIMPNTLQNVSYGLPFQSDENYRDIYIREIWRLFRKIFNYDPKKNQVSVSKYFKNVRLHYIDIREYIGQNFMGQIFHFYEEASQMLSQNQINVEELDDGIQLLQSFRTHCLNLINVLNNLKTFKPTKKRVINPHETDTTKHIHYLIRKSFVNYNNPNIQKKIGKQQFILKKYLHDLVKDCDQLIVTLNDTIDYYLKNHNKLNFYEDYVVKHNYGIPTITLDNIMIEIKHKIELLYDKFIFFFTRFMDVYFLRRFLDKEYITHAITYTGSYHSTVYIELLSKEFGFKITHFYYASEPKISKLNQLIQNTTAEEMGALFYPTFQSQCSDLTHFPEKFM